MFVKHIINFVAPLIFLLLCRALDEANVKPEDIDCLCYTKGECTKTILAIFYVRRQQYLAPSTLGFFIICPKCWEMK